MGREANRKRQWLSGEVTCPSASASPKVGRDKDVFSLCIEIMARLLGKTSTLTLKVAQFFLALVESGLDNPLLLKTGS